jgi:alpha-beta hydrolase superfamily lysophospholipase
MNILICIVIVFAVVGVLSLLFDREARKEPLILDTDNTRRNRAIVAKYRKQPLPAVRGKSRG